jgi:hypothetical protein
MAGAVRATTASIAAEPEGDGSGIGPI